MNWYICTGLEIACIKHWYFITACLLFASSQFGTESGSILFGISRIWFSGGGGEAA